MTLFEVLIDPLLGSDAMKRALSGSLAVSIAGAPLGVMLIIRRMALAGDALTHTLLPGVAAAYLLAGQSPAVMIMGGTKSGLIAVYLSMLVSRSTILWEDISLATFYVLSLALGILLISVSTNNSDGDFAEELLHILFGNALEIDHLTLMTIACVSICSIITFALICRLLVLESCDPVFLLSVGGRGAFVDKVFMTFVVLNLISGATTLGTMMAIGLMTVPGAAARMGTQDLGVAIAGAIGIAITSSISGLLVGHHAFLPPGPTIIMTAGIIIVFSVLFGRQKWSYSALSSPGSFKW